MLTPHHLKSFLSSFVYTPAYTCSHILTNEHDPHHYDVVKGEIKNVKGHMKDYGGKNRHKKLRRKINGYGGKSKRCR